MPVTERHMAPGSWSIKLDPATPPSVQQRLTVRHQITGNIGMGTLVVTPAWVDPNTLPSSSSTAPHPLMDIARYSGVVTGTRRGRDIELRGSGLARWLDKPGSLYTGSAPLSDNIRLNYNFQLSPSQWVSWMVEGGDREGAIGTDPPEDVPMLSSGLFDSVLVGSAGSAANYKIERGTRLDSRLEIINEMCTWAGWEWDLTAQGVFRYGAADNLWPDTRLVVSPDVSEDPAFLTVTGGVVEWDEDIDEFWNRGVTNMSQTYTYVGDGQGPYRTLDGEEWRAEESFPVLDEVDVEGPDDWADREVQAVLGPTSSWWAWPTVTVDGQLRDHEAVVSPGETVWVYDPAVGASDTANEVVVGGETIHPIPVRLASTTWPIVEGMGVYVLSRGASDWSVLDLTPYVSPEDPGSASWEVGAPTLSL
jgi:hypothetical protein